MSINLAAMLRVRNEERWIERCLRSLAFCDRVVLFDDHSSDRTLEIAQSVRPDLLYLPSPFPEGATDEVRDKNFLLGFVKELQPRWVVAPDGDEELTPAAQAVCLAAVSEPPAAHTVIEFRIAYLWDSDRQVRTDGVYGKFSTARAFALEGQPPDVHFTDRGFGGGFHCGSYPRGGFTARVLHSPARVLHYGYIDAALRARKLEFYRRVDPGNAAEDNYRHITQGDPGGEPASARLRHAGPMKFSPLA